MIANGMTQFHNLTEIQNLQTANGTHCEHSLTIKEIIKLSNYHVHNRSLYLDKNLSTGVLS